MNGDEFRLFVCMNRQIPSKRRPGISSSNEGTKINGDCFKLNKRHLYLHVCRLYCAVYHRKLSLSQSFAFNSY